RSANTDVQAEKQPQIEPTAVDDQRYPVDDVTMPTPCEFHVRAKNISIYVAYGSALPLNPCTTIHGRPIPPGYTSVTVEQIVGNNEDLELASLEGMERRHWETHCTGSFYGARPTSNLLQAQRLPCRPIAVSAVSLTAVPTTTSFTTVSTGAKGHEYSNSSYNRKRKEKDSIPPCGWTIKEEAENGRKKINLRENH